MKWPDQFFQRLANILICWVLKIAFTRSGMIVSRKLIRPTIAMLFSKVRYVQSVDWGQHACQFALISVKKHRNLDQNTEETDTKIRDLWNELHWSESDNIRQNMGWQHQPEKKLTMTWQQQITVLTFCLHINKYFGYKEEGTDCLCLWMGTFQPRDPREHRRKSPPTPW